MGQQFDNTNRGALFINERKTQNNHPDYRGNLDAEGVEYWVSAWVKSTAKGDILSISLTPKSATGAPPRNNNQAGPRALGATPAAGGQQSSPHNAPPTANNWGNTEPPMDFDDDIPF